VSMQKRPECNVLSGIQSAKHIIQTFSRNITPKVQDSFIKGHYDIIWDAEGYFIDYLQ